MTKICILGYGVVGTGITRLIDEFNSITPSLDITKILVRNRDNHKNKKYYGITTQKFSDILGSDCDIIIEVMGSISPTYDYIKEAILNGKHVITANKDLVQAHGAELLNLAKQKSVFFKFEASVGGGIPIIRSMQEYLRFTKVNSIKAILNGTTNYMVTQMGRNNLSYDEALLKAQDLGFAESNPEADVQGYDAARKLAILSTLAYKSRVSLNDIHVEGITKLKSEHFALANSLNYKIKLVASSEYLDGLVSAKVEPAFISPNSPFYSIDNELNSILLECAGLGSMIFSGNGAGMIPTATSVLADLKDTISNINVDITECFKNKCNISNKNDIKWTGIISISTSRPESIFKYFKNTFNPHFINISNEDSVLQIAGEFNSYDEVVSILSTLKSKPFIKDIAKFTIL